MALRVRGFPPDFQGAVRKSLALIRQRLDRPPGPIPWDLRAELQNILSSRSRPQVELTYGGSEGICQVPHARSSGYLVVLCQRAFLPSKETGLPRLSAVLFHELVHIAQGWELDAEAFENAWFSAAEGARPPTREDWRTFQEHNYEGWWVRVDRRTRRVTDYADRLIVAFPAPAPRRSVRS